MSHSFFLNGDAECKVIPIIDITPGLEVRIEAFCARFPESALFASRRENGRCKTLLGRQGGGEVLLLLLKHAYKFLSMPMREDRLRNGRTIDGIRERAL